MKKYILWILIFILFFILFQNIGLYFEKQFYLKDYKDINNAQKIYGDLILTHRNPNDKKILGAYRVWNLDNDNINPTIFNINNINSFINDIENIEGIKSCMPRGRIYKDCGVPIRLKNKQKNFYGHNYIGLDFSKLDFYNGKNDLIGIPNLDKENGVILSEKLYNDAKKIYPNLKIGDDLSISGFFNTGIDVKFLGYYTNKSKIFSVVPENSNYTGFILDLESFTKLNEISIPVYKSLYSVPKSFKDIKFKRIPLNGETKEENAKLKKLRQTLGISILQIRINDEADINLVKKEIEKLINSYGYKIEIVNPIDFMIKESEQLLIKNEAMTNVLFTTVYFILIIGLSIVLINEYFRKKFKMFAVFYVLGARRFFILKKIITELLILIIPSSLLGFLIGLYSFTKTSEYIEYVKKMILFDMFYTYIVILVITVLLTIIFSYTLFFSKPIGERLNLEEV